MLTPANIDNGTQNPEDTVVLRHSKRPAWGVGLLVWRTRRKLGVQFEDGRFRKFRADYERLFKPAELTDGERVLAVEMLLEAVGEESIGTQAGSAASEIASFPTGSIHIM